MRKLLLGTALAALVSFPVMAQEPVECISVDRVATDMSSFNMVPAQPDDAHFQEIILAAGIQLAVEENFDIPDNVDVYVNPETEEAVLFLFVGGCFNRQYGPAPFGEVMELLANAYLRMPQA